MKSMKFHQDITLFTDTAPNKTYTPLIPIDSPSPDTKPTHNKEVHNSQCLIIHESPICMEVLSHMEVQSKYERPNMYFVQYVKDCRI